LAAATATLAAARGHPSVRAAARVARLAEEVARLEEERLACPPFEVRLRSATDRAAARERTAAAAVAARVAAEAALASARTAQTAAANASREAAATLAVLRAAARPAAAAPDGWFAFVAGEMERGGRGVFRWVRSPAPLAPAPLFGPVRGLVGGRPPSSRRPARPGGRSGCGWMPPAPGRRPGCGRWRTFPPSLRSAP
jgi:hypothetical protein